MHYTKTYFIFFSALLFALMYLTFSLSSVQALIDPKLNEVMANPIGSDAGNEWIEIYNPEGIDISTWTLQDGAATPNVVPIGAHLQDNPVYDLVILPGQILNNAIPGDTVTLKNSSNTVIDTFVYTIAAAEGLTFARLPDGEEWMSAQAPTQAASNSPSATPLATPTITPSPSSNPTSTPNPTPESTPTPSPTVSPSSTPGHRTHPPRIPHRSPRLPRQR